MARDTLIDVFQEFVEARGEFLVYDDGFRSRAFTLRGCRPCRPRLCRASPRGGASQRRQGRVLQREPPRVDRRILGLPPLRRRHRPDRLSLVSRFSCARQPHRRGETRADRPGRADPRRHAWRARLAPARNGMARRQPAGGRPDARRHRRDHFHVRGNGGPEGRHHHPPEYSRQHRAGRTRDPEVSQVGTAVLSAPLPEPPAAESHVRAGDGDLHPSDAARGRDFHARVQPGRDRVANQTPPGVGARVRAEDPRCAARARPQGRA